MKERLIKVLKEDIERNADRYAEAAAENRFDDAAVYAGKELEARRILTLIEAGRI